MHNKNEQGRIRALEIWQAGVNAVQPARCMPHFLSTLASQVGHWPPKKSYVVVGGGKAGAAMAQATETVLLQQGIPASNIKGWVNVPEGSQHRSLQCIHLHAARPVGYNFPTPQAVAGTIKMLELVDQSPADAVILCLISGGGSAILCAPVAEVSLEDKVKVSQQLSAAGASIAELNIVRKHLSQFKGGGLTRRCFSSQGNKQLISLIISDVIGDPLDVIASGPTAIDPTTFAEALEVLHRKDLLSHAPVSVLKYLEEGAAGKHPETLKTQPVESPRLIHQIVANNALAVQAAAAQAERMGYQVETIDKCWDGDAVETGQWMAEHWPVADSTLARCIISGGETTVKLPAQPGKGGRNQSMALAFLSALEKRGFSQAGLFENITLLCAGTDGEDGPTDAAGAFADMRILEFAHQQGLRIDEFLQHQNAYPFFQATGGLLKTGLTETNVMDLQVFIQG